MQTVSCHLELFWDSNTPSSKGKIIMMAQSSDLQNKLSKAVPISLSTQVSVIADPLSIWGIKASKKDSIWSKKVAGAGSFTRGCGTVPFSKIGCIQYRPSNITGRIIFAAAWCKVHPQPLPTQLKGGCGWWGRKKHASNVCFYRTLMASVNKAQERFFLQSFLPKDLLAKLCFQAWLVIFFLFWLVCGRVRTQLYPPLCPGNHCHWYWKWGNIQKFELSLIQE